MLSKENIKDIYALSPMQEGLFFHELYDSTSQAYMLQISFHHKGELNAGIARRCFQELTNRHDILRTVFTYKKVKQPLQVVLKEYQVTFSSVDLRKDGLTPEVWKRKAREKKFDLTKEVPISLGVLQLGPEDFEVVWTWHHILFDGWCLGFLNRELQDIYQALLSGASHTRPQSTQFRTYIDWLAKQDKSAASDYWKNYLRGHQGVSLQLPLDVKTKNPGNFSLGSFSTTLSPSVLKKLQAFTAKHTVTTNIVLQTVWGVLVARYNSGKEVIFGTVVSGRPPAIRDVESIIGLFINTVPVRVPYSPDVAFVSLVQRVHKEAVAGTDFHFYPLYQIQADAGSSAKLFDHILVYYNLPHSSKDNDHKDGKPVTVYAPTHYNLTVTFSHENGFTIRFEYNTSLFSEDMIAALAEHYKNLLTSALTDPEMSVANLRLSSTAEENEKHTVFNHPREPISEETILELIARSETTRSADKAIVYEGEAMTYRELAALSNRWSHYLKDKHGVRQGDVVAVMLDRSCYMPAILLGILKCGCSYLPLDATHPVERIDYQLQDADVGVLVSDTAWSGTWQGTNVLVSGVMARIHEESDAPCGIAVRATDAAYVIYTSGSTGRPKGVMVDHAGLVNRITWMIGSFEISENDVFFQKTNYTFDVSVWELFLPMCAGAVQVQCRKEVIYDPVAIRDHISRYRITVIHFVAGMLHSFLEGISDSAGMESLRFVIQSGEALHGSTVRRFLDRFGKSVALHNLYGPTEASIEVSSFAVTEVLAEIPIGYPITNMELYVLDERLQVQPVGVKGEIAIAGVGLARGYLNKPELTHERFVEHPFRQGEKLYLTGDLGCWRKDGAIEYTGRKDTQVKIRGYRVELGEIENALLSHSTVDNGVIVLKGTGEQAQLVAYVEGSNWNEDDLSAYLARSLPTYMIPSHYVRIDRVPLTTSGKPDRQALSKLEIVTKDALQSSDLPATDTERKLATIWEEVLDRKNIGVRDNFFELGGHSLKAVRLLARIQKEFQTDIQLREVFEAFELRNQALLIERSAVTSFGQIEPTPARESYPLSHAQRRLWVLCQFEEASIAYHLPTAFHIRGKLNIDAFIFSINSLLDRHEILRTTFKENESQEVRQFVKTSKESGFSLDVRDLRGSSPNEWEKLLRQDFEKPFDLSNGPLWRVGLYTLADNHHVVSCVMHHIVSDAWSMDVLVSDLLTFYHAYEDRAGLPAPLRIQYKDYAAWQEQKFKDLEKDRLYWHEKLKGPLPVLALPTDYPRPPVKTYNGATASFKIAAALTQQIVQLGKREGTTLFMTLLAAVKVLLFRYSGQCDIIVGMPIAGRSHHDLHDQIGFYVNTLAIRSIFSGHQSYRTMLSEVRQLMLDAYKHQNYPFDQLVEELNVTRDMSRSPLFDVMVSLQNTSSGRADHALDLDVDQQAIEYTGSKFDLSFIFQEEGDELSFAIEYNTDLLSSHTVARMARHLENLLASITNNPDGKLFCLEILNDQEKQKLIKQFTGPEVSVPKDTTLMGMFEAQVINNPQNIALICGDTRLTYCELDSVSNRLAHYLHETFEISANDIVGVRLQKSEWMIIAVLAILKTGAAYMPLDPEYPEERIRYMISDSGCKLVLDEETLQLAKKDLDTWPSERLQCTDDPEGYSYVIYTSGSTGKPKGALLKRQPFLNLVVWYGQALGLRANDCVLLMASFSFDLAQKNIFVPLIHGASLCVNRSHHADFPMLETLISANKVTVVNAAPSAFYPLLEVAGKSGYSTIASLKWVVLGGEPIRTKEFYSWLRSGHCHARVMNSYGPTECTDVVSYHVLDDDQLNSLSPIPLGKPAMGCELYVLDNHGELAPLGCEGEICIGGKPLGAGYLNRPELTGERFINNPYKHGALLYKTGDIGRAREDGNIFFVGRKDHQLKVRGFRIELGEVEAALLQLVEIKGAIVVATQRNGDNELVAYLVSDQQPLHITSIRERFSGKLPSYMVPAHFVQVESFPLTPSGKVDRNRLPDPHGISLPAETPFAAPETFVERRLADIWTRVLDGNNIGVNDNFFEIGGQSIKAVQIINHISREFNKKLSLHTFFNNANIRALAAHLSAVRADSPETILPVEEQDHYPLSYSQEKLWMHHHIQQEKSMYNMNAAFHVLGSLNITALRAAFESVIRKHESLRTTFSFVEGRPRQVVHATERFPDAFEYTDRSHDGLTSAQLNNLIQTAAEREFLLEKESPVRLNVVKIKADAWAIIFGMHHIISDGWSLEVFEKDLFQYYQEVLQGNHTPASPSIHFKDFVVWQHQYSADSLHATYWERQLAPPLPSFTLPGTHPRGAPASNKGEMLPFRIDADLTGRLRRLGAEHGSSMFVTLMATYSLLMHRITGQHEIVIGSPMTGRSHLDLQDMIGFFVNTIPLRIRINSQLSFREFVSEIKSLVAAAYDHQYFEIDTITDKVLAGSGRQNRNIFDINLGFHAASQAKAAEPADIQVTAYNVTTTTAVFDLTLNIFENQNDFDCELIYRLDMFNREAAESIRDYLFNLLETVVEHADLKIGEIHIIPDAETLAPRNVNVSEIFNSEF